MKTHIWIGVIPGIFGYGISVASETRDGAMEALKNSWEKGMKASSWGRAEKFPSDSTFQQHFEGFGGHVSEVELGKAYYDNFGE
jgi:hypothetical protein